MIVYQHNQPGYAIAYKKTVNFVIVNHFLKNTSCLSLTKLLSGFDWISNILAKFKITEIGR